MGVIINVHGNGSLRTAVYGDGIANAADIQAVINLVLGIQ